MILDIDECRKQLRYIAAAMRSNAAYPMCGEYAKQVNKIATDMTDHGDITGVYLSNKMHYFREEEEEQDAEPLQNKKCPWCGHTPEVLDARDLMNCKEDSVDYDIKYPYFVRCINAMCNVQPITCGAETKERALEQWNTMQSAISIGVD